MGVGYYVMTPMHLEAGGTVLVNRGYVPPERKDPATRETGEPRGIVRVTGLMRRPEGRNVFTPADDPAAGQYFTRDPATLAARDGVTDAAPFTVDLDATPNPGGLPRGGTTEIAIPNNHLTYALTWFGTALALICRVRQFRPPPPRAGRTRARGRDDHRSQGAHPRFEPVGKA